MSDRFRDDAPSQFALSRRKILIGGGLLVSGLASAVGAVSAPTADSSNPFMLVSSLLIQHQLNADVGHRLAIAMRNTNQALEEHISELLAFAKKRDAKVVEDFFPDIPDGPVKDTALAIISAWYLGVVDEGPDAEVIAYELALLYQPTADVMTIPSYAISGPNGWNADSPPLTSMPKF